MDISKYFTKVDGIHDPSIKPLASVEFLTPTHERLERERLERAKEKKHLKRSEPSPDSPTTSPPQAPPPDVKRVKRGHYGTYSQELREKIVAHAQVYGVSSAAKQFSKENNGEFIPKRTGTVLGTSLTAATVRQFVVNAREKRVLKKRGGSCPKYGMLIELELVRMVEVSSHIWYLRPHRAFVRLEWVSTSTPCSVQFEH
jgi:hypothetical protein